MLYKSTPDERERARKRRERIKNDPVLAEQERLKRREWLAKNPQTAKEREGHKRRAVRNRLLSKGLSPDLEPKVKNHCGKCDLCGGDPVGRWKSLAVDHCHTTGKFRGMLCSNCNVAIGLLKDDPELMIKAAQYVKKFQEENKDE